MSIGLWTFSKFEISKTVESQNVVKTTKLQPLGSVEATLGMVKQLLNLH